MNKSKKTIVLAVLLAVAAIFIHVNDARAQVGVHFNINIGTQPDWGPSGYDYAEYYYMPDIETYYYVPRHEYIYFDHGEWIHVSSLPGRYRDFDLYHCHKVVINERHPYLRHAWYREHYAEYRGRHDQVIIRDNPHGRGHDHMAKAERHDNGRHEGWEKHDRGPGRRGGEGRHGEEKHGRDGHERHGRQ